MAKRKSWRATMPPRHKARVHDPGELVCSEGDVEELVERANAELDAKELRIQELETRLERCKAEVRALMPSRVNEELKRELRQNGYVVDKDDR